MQELTQEETSSNELQTLVQQHLTGLSDSWITSLRMTCQQQFGGYVILSPEASVEMSNFTT